MAEVSNFEEFLEARIRVRLEQFDRLIPLSKKHNESFKSLEKYAKSLCQAGKTGDFGSVVMSLDVKKITEKDCSKENDCPNTNSNENEINLIENVKREKLSNVEPPDAPLNNAKKEMPAPTILPPKKKRIKTEKESINEIVKKEPKSETRKITRSTCNMNRDSDVIIEKDSIPFVDLAGSDDDKEEDVIRSTRTRTKKKAEAVEGSTTRTTRTKTKKVQELEMKEDPAPPMRSTRTRTKALPKRDRSLSNVSSTSKRSKSDSGIEQEQAINASSHTEYEDAVSDFETRPDHTFLIPSNQIVPQENSKAVMNKTVIIDKPEKNPATTHNVNDLLTDDESFEEPVASSPQKTPKAKLKECLSNKKQGAKEVFSPFDKSPVKKKVQAFEKFQNNDIPTSSKANTSRMLKEMEENKGNVKEKAKTFTPLNSKTLYKKENGVSSASKIGKYTYKPVLNNSMSSEKNLRLTPLQTSRHKLPQTDFRERQLKQQEREKEQKKKELLKAAEVEDRKKKYDEKVMKMQQQKDAKEKEKEKILEAKRLKEDKVRLVLQQKEDILRQKKEENERKRLLAKQRAEEKKRIDEEAIRMAAQRKLQEQENKVRAENPERKAPVNNKIPIYMIERAPLLKCNDCYDSDDENYSPQRRVPIWATDRNVRKQDIIQSTLGHKIKNTLFCCQNTNINLQEIFQIIDPKKLKRTSSACWERPPRFTMLTTQVEED